MKKALAFTLLGFFLAGSTEFHHLLKVPVFIHHYLEHKKENPDTSISGFLADHYSEKLNHSHQGHQDHEHLPFKSGDCPSMHFSFEFFFPHNTLHQPSIVKPEVLTPVCHGMDDAAGFLSNIWQPPRLT